MTQAHLAQAAGVSARTVMRAENGEDVSPESIRAICSVLGLDAAAVDIPVTAVGSVPDPSPGVAPTTLPRPYHLPMALAAAALFLALAVALSSAVLGITLPRVYAQELAFPEAMGMRKGLQLVTTLSKPMDALSGDVDPSRLSEEDWSVEPDKVRASGLTRCDDPGFWNFFTDMRRCRPWHGGVKVIPSPPGRFEAVIGPLPGKALAMTARLLTPNPRLDVSVAFSESEDRPGAGFLWIDPRHLQDGQVPQHPSGLAYLHLVTTLREPAR